jgi:hypothetical protein
MGQVSQAAMDQFGGARRSRAGEIAAVDQCDLESADCGLARRGRPVNPAAYDRDIEALPRKALYLLVTNQPGVRE